MVLTLTQWCNLRQLSGLRDDLDLLRVSCAKNRETETDLSMFLHLVHDCAPSGVPPKVRGISHDIETMLGS